MSVKLTAEVQELLYRAMPDPFEREDGRLWLKYDAMRIGNHGKTLRVTFLLGKMEVGYMDTFEGLRLSGNGDSLTVSDIHGRLEMDVKF